MLAKSLVIFVGIGIASGFTLGIYLVEVKDGRSNSVDAVEGPAISLLTTKSIYEMGEEVIFHIVNSGTTPLLSEDGSYGASITGLSGMVIYEFTVLDMMVEGAESSQTYLQSMPQTLWPGDRISVSWDQTRHDGDLVQAGLYKMRVDAYADVDTSHAAAVVDVGSDLDGKPAKDVGPEAAIRVEDSVTVTVR